ncbi:hypothetical protein BJ684DRAFT_21724 [Piptocephalis cylindrospora]|uniref:HNH nuclease domain-containing protein n=1 Tax=Piptocephalis cylindrospora TaxID=1907219 RepID=A0A4P9XZ11_9FUNG|nr:hypothetical protein BJ684DRAFT_21724 [Piptocephalis cylindrospora]|eukprot:RKP11693.1 hypothetical protein BJ684DRAFT_21724 [Piptocephalis cylindrospora]
MSRASQKIVDQTRAGPPGPASSQDDNPMRLDKKGFKRPCKASVIYDNCTVLTQEGHVLFRKRLEWYLTRGLADPVDDTTVRLTFQARGPARSSEAWHIQDRVNQCVVCGVEQEEAGLMQHHVVPSMYRKEMPETLKSRNDHDILPLCDHCHERYGRHAHAFKTHLAHTYEAPLEGVGWIYLPHLRPVIKAARALSSRNVIGIPLDRQEHLRGIILDWWLEEGVKEEEERAEGERMGVDGDDVAMEDTSGLHMDWEKALKRALALEDRIKGPSFSTHAQMIIRRLSHEQIQDSEGGQVRWPDLEEFIRQWRGHFLSHSQHRYLSPNWQFHDAIA